MGAGAGGQIPAPGQQLHGPVVDLLVAAHGVLDGLAALGKGRGVQNDEVVFLGLTGQGGQQVEHVGAQEIHLPVQAVAPGVLRRAVHGELAHVHRRHVPGAALGGVQGKGAGVGEAVQHRVTLGQPGHRPAVVLLIQKEPGFLAVDEVHGVCNAVFRNGHRVVVRRRLSGQGIPALALGHALLVPEGHVVAQVYAVDLLAVLPQHLHQRRENHVLPLRHAQAQHLGHQHRAEAVHRQAGEEVRLPEDDAAAEQVILRHHRLAVGPGVGRPPLPEGGVKGVVGVAAHQAAADGGMAVVKGGAQVAALAAHHVHQPTVGDAVLHLRHLSGIHPGVPLHQGRLPLGGDMHFFVGPLHLHGRHRLSRFYLPRILPHTRPDFHIYCKRLYRKDGNFYAHHLFVPQHPGV